MLSNLADYQGFIERTFIGFLQEQGASEITQKNYRTDLRHFFNWIITTGQKSNLSTQDTPQQGLLKQITTDVLEQYKRDQILNQVPVATINRRFSTLRMFFKCAAVQGWIIDDPTQYLTNIPKPTELTKPSKKARTDHLLPPVHLLSAPHEAIPVVLPIAQ